METWRQSASATGSPAYRYVVQKYGDQRSAKDGWETWRHLRTLTVLDVHRTSIHCRSRYYGYRVRIDMPCKNTGFGGEQRTVGKRGGRERTLTVLKAHWAFIHCRSRPYGYKPTVRAAPNAKRSLPSMGRSLIPVSYYWSTEKQTIQWSTVLLPASQHRTRSHSGIFQHFRLVPGHPLC